MKSSDAPFSMPTSFQIWNIEVLSLVFKDDAFLLSGKQSFRKKNDMKEDFAVTYSQNKPLWIANLGGVIMKLCSLRLKRSFTLAAH